MHDSEVDPHGDPKLAPKTGARTWGTRPAKAALEMLR